ncbi:MAG: phosphate starvation-inducible protein PhoH, partial [Micavibrio aeruginosavorus]
MLFGEHNSHLHYLEDMLDVDIASRGNTVAIKGTAKAMQTAEAVLEMMWSRLEKNQEVSIGDFDAALRFARGERTASIENGPHSARENFLDEKNGIKSSGSRIVTPRTPNQSAYIEAIRKHDMTFGIGPAGTGKTFLAVAAGVEMFRAGEVERLVFTRPAVEAGERLGFLPGDLLEKIDPYLRPIHDALRELMPPETVLKKMASSEIEIAPLAFMRGRTLKNAFVVLDEAQNTTPMQMKMFLTRMGQGARMVINGDPSQTDLPNNMLSGLKDAMGILKNVPEVAFIHFDKSDVVRHKLVGKIIDAYDTHERK